MTAASPGPSPLTPEQLNALDEQIKSLRAETSAGDTKAFQYLAAISTLFVFVAQQHLLHHGWRFSTFAVLSATAFFCFGLATYPRLRGRRTKSEAQIIVSLQPANVGRDRLKEVANLERIVHVKYRLVQVGQILGLLAAIELGLVICLHL
jgi:hypothetical protein